MLRLRYRPHGDLRQRLSRAGRHQVPRLASVRECHPSGAGWLPDRGRVSGRRGDATCRMADDPAVRVDVPSGTVTFLFTDVEGSTRDEVA